MSLKSLLYCQLAYCLLGIGYNAVSYIMTAAGRQPLAPTLPIVGAVFMIVYGLFLLSGYFHAITVYRVLMGLSIVVFGYGGIVKHILNAQQSGMSLYSSTTAWALAIGINLFGLVLNVIAVSGKFR